jgi:hypothetical protein
MIASACQAKKSRLRLTKAMSTSRIIGLKKVWRLLLVGAACWWTGVAMAGGTQPLVVLLHPGAHPADNEAIVVPAGSPMQVASFPRDFESNAVFHGRFTVSGAYEIEGYGDGAGATIRPNKKSAKMLPYWRQHGGPDQINISNPWAFAQAVLSQKELHFLKATRGHPVRGTVTIVADDYSSSIECDVASFSARFISVLEPAARLAANPPSDEGC